MSRGLSLSGSWMLCRGVAAVGSSALRQHVRLGCLDTAVKGMGQNRPAGVRESGSGFG
eukprot:CAMPEP_0173391766 /NCGR_PEP_ID=MMETSP1356-20130122/18578_1 /TAXON_ID=77927 ORGANISM="Hemiselmis virescens, Strain PCC157" /NCGR_SAMPLE_ID=MMETSP1356 /ASSEMBLY_ACC=CAM_ASM_000847 /LENGTH=57 /DNA_ID=CAMNT_0014349453 /DNA_START=148 /DNA_END=318 /DNA_ORIENTATION=-